MGKKELILGHFGFSVVTSVTFSCNLRNKKEKEKVSIISKNPKILQKNLKKSKKNPKKSENAQKTNKMGNFQKSERDKKIEKTLKVRKNPFFFKKSEKI